MTLDEAYTITAPPKPATALDRAAAELRATAETIGHAKLANMLRVCADALSEHPEPLLLCINNHGRLWLAVEKADTFPDGPTATEIHLAALAFDRAANMLRGAI